MKHTVSFVSLGCAKNQVDCEQMMYLMSQAGWEIHPEPEDVDLVVINTCGFIDAAKSEAIDNILAAGRKKAEGRVKKILVTGCLAQRYQQEILTELPEVDGILGTGSYHDVVAAARQLFEGRVVSEFCSIHEPVRETGRILTTPAWYSFVKIAEGCDNCCAFCVIPKLRGKFRSRAMEDIVTEAEGLAANGTKELIVVAQDTSRYGIDRYGKRMLPELLRRLCRVEGIHWVRVHYTYPDEITDELIDVMAAEPKIVKYLDIPIQHVNDEILRRMNRRGNKAYLEALFPKLRERIPGLVIRTSLIAGLPGEGEAEFEELCEFLRRHRLERVGAFAFSPEEGTPAAKMEYPDEEVARRRADYIAELQSEVIDAWNESQFDKILEVLVEDFDGAEYYGRTYADSPGIDGQVRFTSDSDYAPGTFVKVEILGAEDGDLIGREADEQ
ncbi:MAG: 30S ribosomal protein S12 methylthiotransferase RimO [Oscillospiraceae bacterium]|nr:30S ribosomal protein S12 methylthiotransferase RimO [Oscillospiraceae bacterium]